MLASYLSGRKACVVLCYAAAIVITVHWQCTMHIDGDVGKEGWKKLVVNL